MRKTILLAGLLLFSSSIVFGQELQRLQNRADKFDEIENTAINSVARSDAEVYAQNANSANPAVEPVKAPKKKNSFWTKEKLIYGGNFGFRLDPSYFEVLIMPEIGYQFFKPWRITVAPKYEYSGAMPKYEYQGQKSHTAGVQVSTSVDFVRFKKNSPKETGIFIFAAYVYEHQWDSYTSTNPELPSGQWTEYDSDYFDVGIGIRQKVGRRSTFNIMATWHFYDSYYKQLNPGSNGWFAEGYPTISVGFTY